MREEKEKRVKGNKGFMRADTENQTEISEESRIKRWSSNAKKNKRNRFSG